MHSGMQTWSRQLAKVQLGVGAREAGLSILVYLLGFSCIVCMHIYRGVLVWGIFSWHTLGPSVPTEHHLNAAGYLSFVADRVHPFINPVYLLMASSNRIMHHVTKVRLVSKT